jgi:hypothetical protein
MQSLYTSLDLMPSRVLVSFLPKKARVHVIYAKDSALDRQKKVSSERTQPVRVQAQTSGEGMLQFFRPEHRAYARLLARRLQGDGLSSMDTSAPAQVAYAGAKAYGSLSTQVHRHLAQGVGSSVGVYPILALDPFETAGTLAQSVAKALEAQQPLRRVLKTLVAESERNPLVRGLRIRVAGRIQGAEIARVESRRSGQTPLQVFSRPIDYAHASAYTPHGILGVKVWVCYHGLDKKGPSLNDAT